MQKILIVAIIVLSFFLLFVFLFEKPQVSTIKDVSIEKKVNDEIFISCKFEIANKSCFDISCNSLITEVYYNKNIIAEGTLNTPVILKSNEKSDLPLLVKIDKSQFYEGVKDLLLKDSINLVITTNGKCTWANIAFHHENEKWLKSSEIINLFKDKIGSILGGIFARNYTVNNISPSIVQKNH